MNFSAEHFPTCPLCGEVMVPAIIKTGGSLMHVWMCDCNNEDEDAEHIREIRSRMTALIIDLDNDGLCENECEECQDYPICFKTQTRDPRNN